MPEKAIGFDFDFAPAIVIVIVLEKKSWVSSVPRTTPVSRSSSPRSLRKTPSHRPPLPSSPDLLERRLRPLVTRPEWSPRSHQAGWPG